MMKRILITGSNSYIGTSFSAYMAQWPDAYHVEAISVRGDDWKKKSFSDYDVVLHVAGIAHIKETVENSYLYYQINRDLAIQIAEKAKCEAVMQFVFLSTMAVYGMDEGTINKDTVPTPRTNYGKGKLEAERVITTLSSPRFCVTILRPPMVYGEGCKGNYQKLKQLIKLVPCFPDYANQRSVIHIEKLCQVLKQCIDENTAGVILPQDDQYICTCHMAQEIAKRDGKQLLLLRFLNPVVKMAVQYTSIGKKVFGNLIYEKESY